MSVTCEINLLTCDIDQFYIIINIDIWGIHSGFNLTEIYNLRNIIYLSAEGIKISYKIKFLRRLKRFNNTIQHSSLNDNWVGIASGDLKSLDELCSMNISFNYGYFLKHILPNTTRCYISESKVFPGHYICNRFV